MSDDGFEILSRSEDVPFRLKNNFPDYWSLRSERSRVLLQGDLMRDLQAAARRAAPLETGGLLVGRVFRDDQGRYAAVVDFVEAPPGTGTTGHIVMSSELITDLRRQAAREQPTSDVIGWWHSHLTESDYSQTDRMTQQTWTDPENVGILVYARPNGTHIGKVHLGPDGDVCLTEGRIPGETRPAFPKPDNADRHLEQLSLEGGPGAVGHLPPVDHRSPGQPGQPAQYGQPGQYGQHGQPAQLEQPGPPPDQPPPGHSQTPDQPQAPEPGHPPSNPPQRRSPGPPGRPPQRVVPPPAAPAADRRPIDAPLVLVIITILILCLTLVVVLMLGSLSHKIDHRVSGWRGEDGATWFCVGQAPARAGLYDCTAEVRSPGTIHWLGAAGKEIATGPTTTVTVAPSGSVTVSLVVSDSTGRHDLGSQVLAYLGAPLDPTGESAPRLAPR